MGDRIAILDVGGVLEQYDTPARDPRAARRPTMVADFVGADRALKRLRVTADRSRAASSTRRRVPPDATLADARAAIAQRARAAGSRSSTRTACCAVYVDADARTCGDGAVASRTAAHRDDWVPLDRTCRTRSPVLLTDDGLGRGARRRPLRRRAHARVGVPRRCAGRWTSATASSTTECR